MLHHRTRAASRNIIRSNLILNLDAGDVNSYSGTGTTWYDLSGYNNNATIVGSPAFTPGGNGYFTSNSAGQYFTVADSPLWDLGNNFTLDLWVYLNTYNVPDGSTPAPTLFTIDSYGNAGNGNSGVGIWLNEAGPGYISVYSSIDGGKNGTQTVPITTWCNVVITRVSGTYSSYINNTFGSISGGINPYNIICTSKLTIGYDGTSSNSTLQGRWSIVRLYNRGLNSKEVAQNFNATRNRFGI